MKGYTILVLTDHTGHSDQNSIYELLRQMHDDDRISGVWVASRGFEENAEFFKSLNGSDLYAKIIDETFSFSERGDSYLPIQKIQMEDFDIIFLRLPRPISDEFLLGLERLFNHATIVNRPSGIIETSNKAFLLNLKEYCPPIKLCNTVEEVEQMAASFPIVLKPLKEYGGKGLLKLKDGKVDDGDSVFNQDEYLERIQDTIMADGYLAMKYLKNVTKGDKRILVVNGEIMAASLRLPAADSWLCNVAQGGTSVASYPDQDERIIIEAIAPMLKDKGVLIYGVDTLVDDNGKRVLSEINTLSIGGFPQAERQTGTPIIKKTIDSIIKYANERS